MVALAEVVVLEDADLTGLPLREPVAVRDGVLGLDGAVREDGLDAGGRASVLVRADGRVFEVPVLDLVGLAVAVVELLLRGAVDDRTVDVDAVPGADELLLLAPLRVDNRLDAVWDGNENGLLHDVERVVGLGLALVELDQGLCVHVNSSSPLVEWRNLGFQIQDINTILA